MAVRTNTRSPQTTGDAHPRPGISTFQRTLLVSLHSVGGLAVRDTPAAKGPRHCGQYRSPPSAAGLRPIRTCAAGCAKSKAMKSEAKPQRTRIPKQYCRIDLRVYQRARDYRSIEHNAGVFERSSVTVELSVKRRRPLSPVNSIGAECSYPLDVRAIAATR